MNHETEPRLSYDTPTEIGWYATLHTWEPLEGFIPGAHYWDGKLWRTELGGISASVIYWPILFETKEEAEAYADAEAGYWGDWVPFRDAVRMLVRGRFSGALDLIASTGNSIIDAAERQRKKRPPRHRRAA